MRPYLLGVPPVTKMVPPAGGKLSKHEPAGEDISESNLKSSSQTRLCITCCTSHWRGQEATWRGPVSDVTLPVSLQVFHVAYVLIKFANSPRPDLWVLERSTDFGHTYQPWQFFACECPELQDWSPCCGARVASRPLMPSPDPCDGLFRVHCCQHYLGADGSLSTSTLNIGHS